MAGASCSDCCCCELFVISGPGPLKPSLPPSQAANMFTALCWTCHQIPARHSTVLPEGKPLVLRMDGGFVNLHAAGTAKEVGWACPCHFIWGYVCICMLQALLFEQVKLCLGPSSQTAT